jgi:hypothetical protein
MTKQKFLRDVVNNALTIALSFVGIGCAKHEISDPGPSAERHDRTFSHNLERVRCKKNNGGGRVDIEVGANPNVFTSPDDRVVFLCESESVRWFTNDSNIKFTVSFKDPVASKLFKLHVTTLTWDPDAPHNGLNNETPTEVVDTVDPREPVNYSYSVDVFNRQGHLLQHIDPHVIPMGK